MAGMLGLGTQGAAGLSQANIDKLKASERDAKVKPIENNLAKWEQEKAALSSIKTKVNDFMKSAKAFDLYSKDNAFEQLSAQTEGSSVTFQSVDGADVEQGNTDVLVKQLATRDVYQSAQLFNMNQLIHPETKPPEMPMEPTAPEKPERYDTYGFVTGDADYKLYQQELEAYETAVDQYDQVYAQYEQDMLGYQKFLNDKEMEFQKDPASRPKIIIETGNKSFEFETYGKTYQDIYNEMKATEGLDVSLARVTKDSSRIAIKSVETGTENSIKITQNNVDIGFADPGAHVVTAQDMVANIDGIDYLSSSNTMEVKPGLMMTAVSAGRSSINVERDDGTIMPAINEFVDNYNMLIDELSNATTNPQSPINDRATLRMIQSQVKDILMQGYGKNGENNLFVNGFEFDKSGRLNVNQNKLSTEISKNYGLIKELFVGNNINMTQGMGTRMSEYLDSLDGFSGGINLYENNLDHRKEVLQKDKKNALEDLDQKYKDLASKYAAYTDVISRMEASFKGFQNMIR